MKKRIVIDVANLTVSSDSFKKTGIQEVIHQVLLNIVNLRSQFTEYEIILLPFLPSDDGTLNNKLFLNNPSFILEEVEDSLRLPSNEIWGFDLRGKYSFKLNDLEIFNFLKTTKMFHLQSLYDLSHVMNKFPSISYSHTFYDITPFLLPEFAHDSVVDWFDKYYLKTLSKFNKIVSISRHGLYDLLDYKFCSKSQVLRYLQLPDYEIDLSKLNKIETRRDLEDKKYFVVVGSVEPRKNILNLLKGFSLFSAKNSDFHLVFVGGTGWKNDHIYEEIFKNSLIKEKIIFTGYLDDYHMYSVVRGAIGVCMISNYEGFGLPLSLANSLGVPTMANWGSSLPEASGYNSIFVNSWDEYNIANGFGCLKDLIRNKTNKKVYNWHSYSEKLIESIIS